jgi:hypothetical protein
MLSVHKERVVIKCFFDKLKRSAALQRTGKLLSNFIGLGQLAAIAI